MPVENDRNTAASYIQLRIRYHEFAYKHQLLRDVLVKVAMQRLALPRNIDTQLIYIVLTRSLVGRIRAFPVLFLSGIAGRIK